MKYKTIAVFYDLLDVIYFRKDKTSPRRVVSDLVKAQEHVLDLCTGTGTVALRIAKENPKSKVVGIDLSKNMIEVAKGKLCKQSLRNVKFSVMDATNTSFENKSFDKVLLSLLLHEVNEALASRILEEAMRVLKDDGELLVTEWEPSKSLWKKILFLPIHILEPKYYHDFIKKDLDAYFRGVGLKIVEELHCDYSKVFVLKKI
ncbi:MAG: methyltransferase domain-containing protein [Lachnospiraceae bacterium]|nr:methyltransferase domain-containing protein [Lachnospiraceae bacterium]